MNFIKSVVKGVLITIVVILVLLVIIALAMPTEEQIDQGMTDIKTDVAADFERQYQSASLHGTMVDRCVRAGLVAEGYLQAGNEVKYAQWKRVEDVDCQSAGVMR
ncbi:MAG: hypothetical protein ACU0B7_03400 [Paracoccaceae bacterium]